MCCKEIGFVTQDMSFYQQKKKKMTKRKRRIACSEIIENEDMDVSAIC